jgi:hypothetical protein
LWRAVVRSPRGGEGEIMGDGSAGKPVIGVGTVIQEQLDEDLDDLEKKLDADVMSIMGPIVPGLDERVRTAVERIDPRRSKLVVVLDTMGGVVEVVERMVGALRHHYQEVTFVIPGQAMSAGTVLALSGDAIMMDYFSALGPIDPQVQRLNGQLLPATAYLIQFDRLIKKAAAGQLTTAELALLQKLDLAELQQFEEARGLSIELLKKWLVKYKFKNWKETDERKIEVTPAMREARADEIATALMNAQRWHSHGRAIPMEVLRTELRLRIDDFGADRELSKVIHRYFSVLREYMELSQYHVFVHTRSFF